MADKTVTYRLAADITAFRAQMAQAAAAVRQSANEMTAATKKGQEFRSGLTTLGSTAGKVGLIAAAGLGAAVLSAANFDEAMAHVQAATHESAANMSLLRDAALEAGARTVFSATEAANAVEELAKAGVSTRDILGGGLNAALDLASAGTLDVAQAAEIAATTMNQFGLSGQDAGRVADVLAAAAGKAQGEVTDIAEAMKYVGPVAHQMGVSLEEAGGSIAYLATQGIQGEQAGTGLRGMLLSLTSPSKQAKEEMDRLGISMYDAQGHFIGLDGVAGQLQKSMSGLSEADRDEALGRIFGNAQVTTARILYAGGAQAIKEWTKAVGDSGYASETAAIKMDSLKGDLEKLGGALQTALIGAGSGSQGPLRSIVQDITKVVDAFNDLPPAARSATTSLLGVTAVIGGGLWFGSKVISGIADTREALGKLGVEAGTTRAALAGIGKGLELYAIVEGLRAIDDAFDKLANTDFDESTLSRSLTALADGRVTGTIAEVWGEDLGKVGKSLDTLDSNLAQTSHFLDTFIPGDDGIDEARQRFEALDAALAAMVESGNTREAKAAFDQIADAAVKQGGSVAELTDQLPQYGIALGNAGKASNFFGKTFGGLSAHMQTLLAAAQGDTKAIAALGDSAGPSAERLKALEKALEDSRKAASDTAHQFFNLGDGLDDAKVSLGEWLRSLEKQATALRDFRLNAERAAKRGLDEGLIKSLEAAGAAGALRMKQLANATDSEIDRANAAWKRGQREIDKYVDSTVKVPKALATDLTVNGVPEAHRDLDGVKKSMAVTDALKAVPVVGVAGVATAIAQVASLASRIAALHDRTIYINTVGTSSSFGGRSTDGSADGGTVPKTNLPYADRHPYMLADGEEVISNRYGQADRNRALLKAINAGRLADGGTAGIATYARTRGPGHYTSTRELDDAAQALAEFNHVLSGATRSTETWDNKLQMNHHLLHDEERELRLLNKAYEDHRAAVQAEAADLQELRQERQALKQSVASNFNGDQWYQSTPENGMSAWQALALSLTNQTTSANAFQDQLRAAQGHGLSGGLFQFIAQSGDSALATEFAGMTRQQIRDAEKLFQQRNQAAAAVGSFAGDTIYGHDIREQTHELKGLRADSKAMRDAINRQEQIIKRQEKTISRLEKTGPERTGDAVGKRINSSAAAGRRRRNP